jgi:hypothetical protein
MTTPDSSGTAGTGGKIDIEHTEAEAVGRKLEAMGGTLKNVSQGGNGSAYGIDHWEDMLGGVLVLDGDLKGIVDGLRKVIQGVSSDMREAARVTDEYGKALLAMSGKYKGVR